MIRQVGVHRVDHTEIISVGGDVGKQGGKAQAGLAVLAKGMGWTEQLGPNGILTRGGTFARVLDQLGLVVKQIHMGRAPPHGQKNDSFGPGRKVWQGMRKQAARPGNSGGGRHALARGERRKSEPAEAEGGLLEKVTTEHGRWG